MSDVHLADLWAKQSELLWKLVVVVPVVEAAIVVAWYQVQSDGHARFAKLVLWFGILASLVVLAITWRVTQYLNSFRTAAGQLVPDVDDPKFGLSGYRIARAIPIMFVVIYLSLLFFGPTLMSEVKCL